MLKLELHGPIKRHCNSIRYNSQKICSYTGRLKTILEVKKVLISSLINKSLIYIFFKDFTNNKKRTKRVEQFSARDLSTIFLNIGSDRLLCFISIGKSGSFKKLFTTRDSLSELVPRHRNRILRVQTKETTFKCYDSSKTS